MNHQQNTQRGNQDNMAAATAAYNDQQMAGGNMGMGMHQQFNGQSNMFGGDSTFYQLDPATFDSQNPPPIDPNQTPLLNNGESDFLQNFFDDPNQIDPNHINPFDYTARPDEKPASNGNSLYGATVFDHQTGTINANMPQSGQSHQKTHVNARPPNHMSGQQDVLSADDYRAAHTIGNLKATPSSNDFGSPGNSNAFGGSWGNFMMPAGSSGLGMNFDLGFAGAFAQNNFTQGAVQAQNTVHIAQPQSHAGQNSNIQQQHFYAQPQPVPPPQPPSRNQGSDSASQHVRQQQQAQTSPFPGNRSAQSELPHGHGRPPLVQWGSDPHFGRGTGFAAPPSQNQQSKEGNLLNIYGAEQAAMGGQVSKHGRKATGRGNSIASPSVPNNGASWGGMGMGAPSSSYDRDDQPRKRRKSQADREEEHEWAPGQAKSQPRIKTEDSDDDDAGQGSSIAVKRRKSGFNRQSLASNSPEADEEDGEDAAARRRRGAKKARETLTEAQKRDNHIKSEKKRREIITTGYSELNRLVPCLAAGKSGLSRSECLQEVASYLRSLVDGTVSVMGQIGISDSDWDDWRNSAEGRDALRGYLT